MKRSFWQVLSDKRHRGIVLTSAVFLIWILIIFFHQLYRGYENEFHQAKVVTRNTSYILEEHIEGVFKNIDLALTNIVDVIRIRGKNYKWTPEKYQELLVEKNKTVPALAMIKITNKKGIYVGQNEVGPVAPLAVFDRSYFQEHLKNSQSGLVISEPIVARSLNVPVISISRQLVDEDGNFIGIVNSILPISYFKDLFSKIDIGAKGNISLIALKEKILIARYPEVPGTLGQIFKTTPPLENILFSSEAQGSWFAKANFDPYFKTFSVVKNNKYNFMVINGAAEMDYLADWKANLYWSCASVVILLLGFMFGLYSFLISSEKIETQKLQVADSAKMSTLGGLAAGIAHEINNPLAIIQSKTEAIKMALEKNPPNLIQIHSMLTGIDRTVYRIAKTINGLRAFSRSNGKDSLLEFPLEQIVQNAVGLVFEKFKTASIMLKVEDIPTSKIRGNEAQLTETLLCLLSNSHDALLLLKDSRWVSIQFIQYKTKLQIIITDSGLGIDDHIAVKMMDPFFTTKPIGQGSGLGLSTAKGIIESHNGKLTLNNKSKNTQFIIELQSWEAEQQLKQA